MAKNEYKEERGRNFRFVQLVENLPPDWEKVVKNKLLPMAYVVHDKDYYSEDEEKEGKGIAGQPKKPHVHFFVYFNGKRTPSGVAKLFNDLGVSYVERVDYKNGALAYMLHIGWPEKHLYNYDEFKIVNGLKVNFADLTDTDFGDVMEFAESYDIRRFSELCKISKKVDPPIFRYVSSHYALVCAYFSDERAAKDDD